MHIVYLVGAQCTGKTTLSKAVYGHMASHFPDLKCQLLVETARTTLQMHSFTREDVRGGGERCFLLQQLILDGQLERETRAREEAWDIVVSDRSGLDPLIYARMYCKTNLFERLQVEASWRNLKTSLSGSTVAVCEPVQEWLFDDGTRLMPLDWEEWMRTHKMFCELLEEYNIPHVVLSASNRGIESRVGFVLAQLATSSWTLRLDNKQHTTEEEVMPSSA